MHPLNTSKDLTALMEDIADRAVVMLGEASHGTHEYYTWRTAISRRLIQENDFSFIAVEGDWPDCYAINSYIKGYSEGSNEIKDVLKTFARWPTWMWGNWEIGALEGWLRKNNTTLRIKKRLAFTVWMCTAFGIL